MKSPEEFMQQYFVERLVEEMRERASRLPFRERFYAADCRWDSRDSSVGMFQSEMILRVIESEATAKVVTARSLRCDAHQVRYHLRRHDVSWLIVSVDLWCRSCGGEEGHTDCKTCHGAGWV
jgi:transcriptional regulator with GAF, ATPase, and Fis domain